MQPCLSLLIQLNQIFKAVRWKGIEGPGLEKLSLTDSKFKVKRQADHKTAKIALFSRMSCLQFPDSLRCSCRNQTAFVELRPEKNDLMFAINAKKNLKRWLFAFVTLAIQTSTWKENEIK